MRIEREYRPEVVFSILPDELEERILPDFIHFMVVWEEDTPIGCFTLIPHSDVCVFIHTNFLPEGYRHAVSKAVPMILNYVFNIQKWEKLLTEVPVFNVLAKRLAMRAGMVKEGYWKASFRDKNGMHDMEIFGLTKEDYKCQHFRF